MLYTYNEKAKEGYFPQTIGWIVPFAQAYTKKAI